MVEAVLSPKILRTQGMQIRGVLRCTGTYQLLPQPATGFLVENLWSA